MEKISAENPKATREREIRAQLEETHRMILDTKAQTAQVKEDAATDLSRVKELVSLKRTLDTLEYDEGMLKEELEALNGAE